MTSVGHSGEAGHWGKDVRSDMHVLFEARESGSIEISLESRVAPYYGAAIQEQTLAVLVELGVKHARVAIHDEGALPFTIGARIEAAVRRAGAGVGKRWLPEQHLLPAPSPKAATAPLAPLSAGFGAEVLHQCRPAWPRCSHPRS